MVKQWYGFFKNEKKERVVKSAFVLLFGLCSLAIANEDLLSLPVFEWKNPIKMASKSLMPGDSIRIELSDLAEKFSLSTPEGSSSLIDLGWSVVVNQGQVVLSPLRSGRLKLPVLVIKNPNDQPIGRTQPLNFRVQEISKSKEQAKTVLDPLGFEFPWKRLLSWLLLALLIFGLILYFIQHLNQKPKKIESNPIPKEPLLPPHHEAYRALRLLQEKKYWKNGQYKKHYFGLSEIFKKYIGRRFDFDAMESTAKEIHLCLKDRLEMKEDCISELIQVFSKLDRVKFSDYIPEENEGECLIEKVKLWVEQTHEKEVATVADPSLSDSEGKQT